MSGTSSPSSARRRLVALTLVAGAALGLLTTAGLSSAVPAAADVSGRTVATDRSALRAELADTAATVGRGQAAVAAASTAVAEAEASGFDLGPVTIDTRALTELLSTLSDNEAIGSARSILTANVSVATEIAVADTAALRGRLDAAIAKKQADEAAAAEAAAQAAALAAANTPDGARSVAAAIAASEYGWGADQFSCLNSLWNKESGWDYQAYNSSGATGIPQALPGDKMSSAGADWQSNATTQIRWGLGYIAGVYGTPCSAWGHSQSVNWY